MPPHLHPRSRLTTSLFGTTLLVSFLVVGMPHILPCPAPRMQFADSSDDWEYISDGTGRRRRRRRRSEAEGTVESGGSGAETVSGDMREEEEELERRRRKAHECPVPKPAGVIGEVLGFRKANGEEMERSERARMGLRKRDARED